MGETIRKERHVRVHFTLAGTTEQGVAEGVQARVDTEPDGLYRLRKASVNGGPPQPALAIRKSLISFVVNLGIRPAEPSEEMK